MGIKLGGQTFSTVDDILASIETHHKNFEIGYESAKKKEDDSWKQYLALQLETKKAQLKAIYMEALRRGESLDWARGKADGLGLDTDKLSDEEFQSICELFK